MTTTLLAVDDSKTMRKVMEITFSGEDFRLLTCGSADEALAKLGEKPSVAVVDAGLEGTSGYELCRKLKAAQPGLQVLILSNKQQPYDRTLGGQVGADDFADKPFDTQQLIDKVNALAKKAGTTAAAPAPAPAPAPAAQPIAPAPAPRTAATTLSYGSNPLAAAPAPAPMAAPIPRQPTAPGMPAGPGFGASRAPTMLAAGAQAEVARAAVAQAAPAPTPAAVVASAVATNGADFAQKLGA
ncbi:MAG TPA: response regulator, partial [Polyangiaceae bacterium]